MRNLKRLRDAIAAVAPINDIRVGIFGNSATVSVIFNGADVGQQTAAQTVINNFDWSDAAWEAWEDSLNTERKDIKDAAVQAIIDLDTFLAIVSPSNAQVLAVVKKLCQQNKYIIKRLIQLN